MINKKVVDLIQESLKEITIHMVSLNSKNRNSLLAEFKEWFIKDIESDEILMLPYEGYSDRLQSELNNEDL